MRHVATTDRSNTRTQVLDAALEIVAEQGLQALTHRGVEQSAGVSHGTTTYYFSNRGAMIEALLEHVSDRQVEWVTARYAELAAAEPGTIDPDTFSRRMLTETMADRTLTLARYELYLHAARNPHMQDLVRRHRRAHVSAQTELFRTLGAQDPQWAANRFLSTVEGAILYQLAVPEDDFDQWAGPYLNTVMGALTSTRRGGDPSGPSRR